MVILPLIFEHLTDEIEYFSSQNQHYFFVQKPTEPPFDGLHFILRKVSEIPHGYLRNCKNRRRDHIRIHDTSLNTWVSV